MNHFQKLDEREAIKQINHELHPDTIVCGCLDREGMLVIAGAADKRRQEIVDELAAAVAYDWVWQGYHCRPGFVLLSDLESGESEISHRMQRAARRIGEEPCDAVEPLGLRGHADPLGEIRRNLRPCHDLLIIDRAESLLANSEKPRAQAVTDLLIEVYEMLIRNNCGAVLVFDEDETEPDPSTCAIRSLHIEPHSYSVRLEPLGGV